jgi:iron complex outermembrane receptor protein
VIDPCVNWAFNLAHGNINQTIAGNCEAAGIPNNYGGGSISATVFSEGGIGRLSPETSTAKTASVILTPSFPFLPRTKFSLAVDYFDIGVKGEISQLGARNIVFGCYQSASYPTDPLCSLFTRGGNGTDPYALATVHDKYINIAKEQRRGLDFTALIQQNLGRLGSLTILGNATYTLRDTFGLFANSTESLLGIINDDNGRTGTERFVGDVNLSWKPHGGWTLFWDTQIFGKWSNDRIYKADHSGSLCHSSNPADPNYDPGTAIRGEYCAVVSVPTVLYHAASVTKEFGKTGLQLTVGMRNIFNKRPPQVTTIGNGGLPIVIGPVIGTSQYDFLGRRVFFNVTKKF